MIKQLVAEIGMRGPLRFDAFMARALFDPAHGYYAADRARIGRAGDFYTSVSVGRMLGRVLAAQAAEIWERLGRPAEFDLVEQGANDGRLAADILDALAADQRDCFAASRYTLVEPFPSLVERQRATLATHRTRIRWIPSLEALEPFTGLHLTNEYADAFPVRIFVRHGDGWRERHVGVRDNQLAFEDAACAEIPEILPAEAEDGYLAEFSPGLAHWVGGVAAKMKSGAMLVIDYGFPREQLYAPWRKTGTLSCYRSHKRDDNPLEAPSEKDITCHVDFTSLAEAGCDSGLALAGFTDQYHFLVGAGAELFLALETADSSPQRDADLRALKSLLHPEVMGTQFKYLCLSRGIDLSTPLAGFRHARHAAQALNTIPSETRRETEPAPSNRGR